MTDQVTQNPDGSTTYSFAVADLSLDELVALSQRLGAEADKIREQRAYLKRKIDERLANGERNAAPAGDGVAPGAAIEAGVAGG